MAKQMNEMKMRYSENHSSNNITCDLTYFFVLGAELTMLANTCQPHIGVKINSALYMHLNYLCSCLAAKFVLRVGRLFKK